MRLSPVTVPLLVALASCSSTPSGTISLVTGEETDTFTQNPVPKTISAQLQDQYNDAPQTLLAPQPFSDKVSIDLGNRNYSAIDSIEVSMNGADGGLVVYGASLEVQLGALDGTSMNLFVQRVGQSARMPSPFNDVWSAPLLSVLEGQFVVAAGGVLTDGGGPDAAPSPPADAGSDAAVPAVDGGIDGSSAADATVDATTGADAAGDAPAPLDGASDAAMNEDAEADAAPLADAGAPDAPADATPDADMADAALDAAPTASDAAVVEPSIDATVSTATTVDMYDMFAYGPVPSLAALPITPTAMVSYAQALYLFNADAGVYVDYSQDPAASGTIPLPDGGAWSDISGGSVVISDNGTQYVVGGARLSGAPTTRVLVLDPNNNLFFVNTTYPRVGASATWFPKVGLVISGGDGNDPGIEILPALADAGFDAETTGTVATPQGYAADSTFGGVALPVYGDATHMMLFGGVNLEGQDPGARVVTLPCTKDCIPTVWDFAGFGGGPLLPVQGFNVWSPGTGDVVPVVVGDDPTGRTHLFELSESNGAVEFPLKVTRYHARAISLPTIGLGIVGGDRTVESFIP